MKRRPPRWAQRLIEWYCKPELAEDLIGDLNEYFGRNAGKKGVFRAKLIYIIDALKFFRTYTIRTPKFIDPLINWIMIGSYIKTSGRNVMRNKLFSSINIIGLAISMSVGLMMIAFLNDLFSYDRFHSKGDRIYRVVCQPTFGKDHWGRFATTSLKSGKLIKEKIPGIEEVTIIRNGFSGDAIIGDNTIPMAAYWADPQLFRIFDFPLLKGNKKTALEAPYSIVLSERSAKKLFGDKEALGQAIKFDTVEYQVTGVMKDIPFHSHLRFEALVSLSTFERQDKDNKAMQWDDIWSTYVYLLLPSETDLENLHANLDKIADVENAAVENTNVVFDLQPLLKIVVGEALSNNGPTVPPSTVWTFGGLAAIVILSACFNYTNLSIARSLRRFKEVGLRKAIGAARSHVRQQFLYEAVIISLAALILSFGIFVLMSGAFRNMLPELTQLTRLELTPALVVYFIVFSIMVGVIAGFLPALFFSRINVIQALKDVSSVKVFRHVNLRRTLVITQYSFTLIFITATVIGYKQYKSFLTFDVGFETENIVNVKLFNNKPELVIKEFSELPEVTAISKSKMIPSTGSFWANQMKYENMNDSTSVWYNMIDENYLSLHNHEIIAGTNFIARPVKPEEETEAIVTEQTLKEFNIGDPSKPGTAIGEQIVLGGRKLSIVGVVKDFHYGKVNNKIEPVVFGYWSKDGRGRGFANLKIQSSDLSATMAKLEEAWKKVDKIHPIDARFYDAAIEEAYLEFSLMVQVVSILSLLTISIASMGLFGMVVFTTETRLKEISIRKVMGAEAGGLVMLLSRNFILLLGISAIIALPFTWFVFEKLFLIQFPYHEPVGIPELLTGLVGVLFIAFLMIGTQTIKAARTNPAEVLKNE